MVGGVMGMATYCHTPSPSLSLVYYRAVLPRMKQSPVKSSGRMGIWKEKRGGHSCGGSKRTYCGLLWPFSLLISPVIGASEVGVYLGTYGIPSVF